MPSVCHGCRRLSSVNMARWPLLVAAAFLFAQAPIAAVTEVMTEQRHRAGAERRQRIGRDPRTASMRPTTSRSTTPVIEHLEIITEFRRFVLAAEDQLKAGNWMMARGGYDPKGRTLRDLLRPLGGQVSIRARLRFHPQNNYVTLPAFDILLGDPTLLAINALRTPHITPATGEPGTRDVINGATIEVFYNAPTIDDRLLPVRLISEGKEIARVSVDFSRVAVGSGLRTTISGLTAIEGRRSRSRLRRICDRVSFRIQPAAIISIANCGGKS